MKSKIHIARHNIQNDGKGGDIMYGQAVCGVGLKQAELIYHRSNCTKCKKVVLKALKKELAFWWGDNLEIKLLPNRKRII